MRSSYRGYEITVNRERSLGGEVLMYWTIVRESDGWFCEDTFYDGNETVREFVKQLKQRVDSELASDDPWNENGTYDLTPWLCVMKRQVAHRFMRAASWMPLSLLLRIDHMNCWKRDEAGFSFWTDAHYWQYCRRDERKCARAR